MPGTYGYLVGVGGIGSGMFLALRGNHTLGRNESRAGVLLPRRDFCKLHIVGHYVAVLTGAGRGDFAVLPIGRVGDDPAGSAMIQHMRRVGMDTRFVAVQPGEPTLFSVCFVYPDGDGGNVTADDSASSRVGPRDVAEAISALPGALAGLPAADRTGIALAVPEVPLPARMRLLRLGRQRGWLCAAAVTTAEAAEALERGMFALVDLLGANRDEAAALAGLDAGGEIERVVCAAGEKLAAINPLLRLCVTAGSGGSYGWAGGAMEHTPACPVDAVNTAGAGDATLAGLIVATAAGLPFILPQRPRRGRLAEAPLQTALDFAALLAGLAVVAQDTINFDADAEAIRDLATSIGADISRLEPALAPGPGGRHG